MSSTLGPYAQMLQAENTPAYAPFFGLMGVVSAMAFSSIGAAYGTARSGLGISSAAQMRPDMVMKAVVPVVMAGIIAIYGLVISVVLGNNIATGMTLQMGFKQLGAGLACGICGLGAGIAIGIIGDFGVRAASRQQVLFVTMVLILIFAEVLGLYGLIIALILGSK